MQKGLLLNPHISKSNKGVILMRMETLFIQECSRTGIKFSIVIEGHTIDFEPMISNLTKFRIDGISYAVNNSDYIFNTKVLIDYIMNVLTTEDLAKYFVKINKIGGDDMNNSNAYEDDNSTYGVDTSGK
jgi:hypothetical protein